MISRSTPIDFVALHGDMAAGTRVTVVTPNRRLATYLTTEYDATQRRAGLRAWHSADILPLDTFLERSYRTLCSHAGDSPPPQLLSSLQSQYLWEDLVRKSDADTGLLNAPQAARQAFAAWHLAHAWHLLPALRAAAVHEDAKLFLSWARRYEQICREGNLIDSATLTDFMASQYSRPAFAGSAVLPNTIVAAGFDIITPQRRQFFDACAAAGARVEAVASFRAIENAVSTRSEFADEAEEMRTCAAWARRRLETNPEARIAIVVPDLKAKRSQVARALVDTLSPLARSQVQMHDEIASLFNISLGQPLSEYPLVHDALGLIEFSQSRGMAYGRVAALLRSPYIAGAGDERAARALLDAELRKRVAPEIRLAALQKKFALAIKSGAPRTLARSLAHCGKLLHAIDKVGVLSDAPARESSGGGATGSMASPETWSRHFATLLNTWGFPGEPGLSSTEFQVLSKFRDALDSLASLGAVKPKMRAGDALVQLRRLMADTVFQPESASAIVPPIQVLGILESAGQNFDAIWITGLSDEAWPLAARPAPFIPAAFQRAAGVPEASAAASLALDRLITEGWLKSAPEVIFSHARHASGSNADEQIRAASALISDVPLLAKFEARNEIDRVDYARAAQAIGVREPIPDRAFEPLPSPTLIHGGAGVFRDQAACPFRAFARHRLAAEPLETPHAGLDHAERGTLMHRALYLVWGEIGSHAILLTLDASAREKYVTAAVAKAIVDARADGVEGLTGRFAQIEHARLARTLGEWLAYEAKRTPFEVTEREAKHRVTLAGLSMNVRLDRMDRLADGTHALIDYKTGAAKFTSWLGSRPDEPQLPLYYTTADAVISALAFARLKRGERGKVFGFEGVSATEDLLLDVVPIEKKRGMEKDGYVSWDVLTEEWDSSLRALARGFAEGVADVDPKNGGLTCAHCDVQNLCRVAEHSAYSAMEFDAGIAEAPDAREEGE